MWTPAVYLARFTMHSLRAMSRYIGLLYLREAAEADLDKKYWNWTDIFWENPVGLVGTASIEMVACIGVPTGDRIFIQKRVWGNKII